MTTVTLKGKPFSICGDLPANGTKAPDFLLVKRDLSEATADSFGKKKKKKILSIFPSLDTPVCSQTAVKFHELLANREEVVFLNISKDLPFAAERFCQNRNINQAITLSAFRSTFGKDYGIEITEGPLKGLFARAIILLDENNQVLYSELVNEIAEEPNYEKLIELL